MKKSIINYSFTKMLEGKLSPVVSAMAARTALEDFETLKESILSSQGEDAVISVLNYPKIKRCLQQCLVYLEDPNSKITDDDYFIYYDYAYTHLKVVENTIDTELSSLGL